MIKVAAQIIFSRANFGRTWAKNEKKEGGSIRDVVSRFLYSLVTGGVRRGEAGGRHPTPTRPKILDNIPEQGRHRRRNSTQVPDPHHARSHNIAVARRTILDGVLKRVTNSQAAELRRRAFDQLTSSNNSAPFLALLGVSLASGSGIISKEDEIESIIQEIRQAVGKTNLLEDIETVTNHDWSLKDFHLGKPIAKGCAAVVYSARTKLDQDDIHEKDRDDGHDDFPLAVKMMFNYDAESNATSILRSMQRETVPARCVTMSDVTSDLAFDMIHLEPHPNIVNMVTVFADQVPHLPGDISMYGQALPLRINPEGFGRNMSLFLVMKRYDMSLAEYLDKYRESITSRTSLFLMTQLIEAVAFLTSQGVAHRDLKTDNILLSLAGGHQYPQLVITDFGCCLADKHNKLRLSFTSLDTYRGGNSALMAPEVRSARPGPFTSLNYDKSDLWTAGTISYQIFGGDNPFIRRLDSRTYTLSQLPALPASTPGLVASLVRTILSPSPGQRPRSRLVATILQLLLWCPSPWYRGRGPVMPSNQDILQWMLTMATKVMCESR